MSTSIRLACFSLLTALLLAKSADAQVRRGNPFAVFDTSPPLPGQPVPDFTAYDENLEPIRLSDLHPDGILVLQWGCPT